MVPREGGPRRSRLPSSTGVIAKTSMTRGTLREHDMAPQGVSHKAAAKNHDVSEGSPDQ